MLALPIVSPAVVASSSTSTWARTIGGGATADVVFMTMPTQDGGLLGVGQTNSSTTGDYDGWVVKLDASGGVVSEMAYGSSKDEVIAAGEQTSDGGLILVGYTATFIPPNIHRSDLDAWILRIDPSGNIEWQKALDAPGQASFFTSVVESPDGGFLAVGGIGDFLTGDVWLVKLDSGGSLLWQKSVGGPGCQVGVEVRSVPSGGFIVAGTTACTGGSVWLLRLDNLGNVLWQKSYDGVGVGLFGFAGRSTVAVVSDGGFVIAGQTPQIVGADESVAKLDSDGNIVWQKSYGTPDEETAISVLSTSDGSLIVVGSERPSVQTSGLLVSRLDSSGNILWQRNYAGGAGGFPTFSWVAEVADGGFVVTSIIAPSQIEVKTLVLKLDSNGNVSSCSFLGDWSASVSTATGQATSTTATVTDTVVPAVTTSVGMRITSSPTQAQCPQESSSGALVRGKASPEHHHQVITKDPDNTLRAIGSNRGTNPSYFYARFSVVRSNGTEVAILYSQAVLLESGMIIDGRTDPRFAAVFNTVEFGPDTYTVTATIFSSIDAFVSPDDMGFPENHKTFRFTAVE